MVIEKALYEAHLQQIFHMLLENKTNEQIASKLKISIRTVQNYKRRLEQRYGSIWKKKTNDTLFLERNLFKNRMLTLYKELETQVVSNNTSGTDKAKCAEVAANIAIDVLKMESEGIKTVKELASKNVQGKNILNNLRNQSKNEESNFKEKYDPNRKF
jgi:DNA-binding NarL/FixJ family response regulator